MSDEVLTVEEVANRLKISRQAVRALIKDGKLTAKRIGRQFRITSEAVMKYMEAE